MLHVALTGNIAAGKSTVADLFRAWGATVIDADRLARDAEAPGSPVVRAIADRFGTSVIAADGALDRSRLRRLVLVDPAGLPDLNRIVHPEVHRRRAALVAEARARGDRIVVSDIPLLFEATDLTEFDAIVLVDAPAELRKDRLLRHRGLSPEEAERLLAAQWPAGPKRARSDFVIDNTGDREQLEREAAEVWKALLLRA